MWLHSSVGRASHWYRRGHGFESCWSLDFFRLLLSNCLNWKIYCYDHSSLWSTTAVQIYELFHICFTSLVCCCWQITHLRSYSVWGLSGKILTIYFMMREQKFELRFSRRGLSIFAEHQSSQHASLLFIKCWQLLTSPLWRQDTYCISLI